MVEHSELKKKILKDIMDEMGKGEVEGKIKPKALMIKQETIALPKKGDGMLPMHMSPESPEMPDEDEHEMEEEHAEEHALDLIEKKLGIPADPELEDMEHEHESMMQHEKEESPEEESEEHPFESPFFDKLKKFASKKY